MVSGTGRKATGDAATYDATAEAATVTGNVEIIDGANIMRGGRAEVDLRTGNSRMLSSGKDASGIVGVYGRANRRHFLGFVGLCVEVD